MKAPGNGLLKWLISMVFGVARIFTGITLLTIKTHSNPFSPEILLIFKDLYRNYNPFFSIFIIIIIIIIIVVVVVVVIVIIIIIIIIITYVTILRVIHPAIIQKRTLLPTQHLQQLLCFTYNTVLRQITLKVCSFYIKKVLFLHYTESHTDVQIPGRGGGGGEWVLPYETDGDARRLA